MKVYLKGVSDINIRDDGYLDVRLDMVYEKGSVGYDEKGFWVDVPEPDEMRELKRKNRELKGYNVSLKQTRPFTLMYF